MTHEPAGREIASASPERAVEAGPARITEQERAEAALRASEARSRLILDNLPDFVVRIHADGTYLDVSGARESDLLIPAAEHVGKTIFDVLPPEHARTRFESIVRALETGETQLEEHTVDVRGTPRRREIRLIPLGADEVLAVVRDVTDRWQVEQALRRRDAVLEAIAQAAARLLADDSDEGIAEALELLGRAARASRVYVFANEPAAAGRVLTSQRYGWCSPGAVAEIANPRLQRFSLAELGLWRFEDALSRGEPVYGKTSDFPPENQTELRAQDIEAIACVPILVRGEWWGYVGFDDCVSGRDWAPAEIGALQAAAGILGAVLGRRQTEEALRASEATKSALTEIIPDLLFLVSPDGVFVDYKGAAADLAVPAGEIVGRRLEDVLPGGVARAARRGTERALATGELQTFEYVLPLGGEARAFEARLVASGEGNVLVICRDITARKRAEADRERLLASERTARAEAEAARREVAAQNERLLEVDRLKDELVATVSHELRTPLTSILGYVELLRDEAGIGLDGDPARYVNVVERNAKRLLTVVSDLLLVAQLQAGTIALNRAEVDLGRLVRECVETLAPRAGAGEVELVIDAERVPSLEADRARLGQLLDNLVSNGIKFTPEGGRVEVRVRVGERGASVLVFVSDTGVGIPEVEQGRLFERFFRSQAAMKLAAPGIGLGLVIAKAIVDAHGGTIAVESAEGLGTTVRVELPVRAEERSTDPG